MHVTQETIAALRPVHYSMDSDTLFLKVFCDPYAFGEPLVIPSDVLERADVVSIMMAVPHKQQSAWDTLMAGGRVARFMDGGQLT